MRILQQAQRFILAMCLTTSMGFAADLNSMIAEPGVRELNLDGQWKAGIDRKYDRDLQVPGLATDPTQPTPGTLWYRKTVDLPAGPWTNATLTLKGARFAPAVYIDGQFVSESEGGMAPTVHRFALGNLSASRSIVLEIALKSLTGLDPKDASATPPADLWRSNVSSYLWDSVVLRLHGDTEIGRLVPWPDTKTDSVTVRWSLKGKPQAGDAITFKIIDQQTKAIVKSSSPVQGADGTTKVGLQHLIQPWSPESPNLYRLRTELTRNGDLIDATEQNFGIRDFSVRGLGFELNGKPFHLRMGTVVWHRWTRDPEAQNIAFDAGWFEKNIVLRLKDLGANGLRFHLGLPPEKFLDLCDRDGLAVQMEWPFFHGILASEQSMSAQWQAWLDVAMRHPCVVTVQAWNETEGEQLKLARGALDPLLKTYPPLVVNHIDVIPVHKYWWSLFENLGLYYDSAAQFQRPVMSDEFGGNYLDGQGNPGQYPETVSAFLRFLGRGNSVEERLELHTDSNARVAEYWRRLGVAGFSPFCILGSPKDGSHWFMGRTDVSDPQPKPVWAALSAAFAPKSLSLELWNRNFAPGEKITTPLWFFNDTDQDADLMAGVSVEADPGNFHGDPLLVHASVKAHSSTSQPITIPLPSTPGEWRVSATMEGLVPAPSTPIVSSWHVRTIVPALPDGIKGIAIGVYPEEKELRQMLEGFGIHLVDPADASATLIVGSQFTWSRLRGDRATVNQLDHALHRGVSIVLLDAGPQPLGVGYTAGQQVGGPLEGVPQVANPALLEETKLFGGVHISFHETAEPESTLQQPEKNQALWSGLPKQATWLWDGLRGGLIVPAADMQVTGLSGQAIITMWQQRGADPDAIKKGSCYAYALAGYYAYSDKPNDAEVAARLRQRVKFLVEDAPALENVVNPNAPIVMTDLGSLYRGSGNANEAQDLVPLANAGKDLYRTPVIQLRFAPGAGTLILSQLLTHGRLLPTECENGPGVYGLRYDPVAVQVVLNMLNEAAKPK